MLLLLDTHAWIWVVDGDRRRVGARARRLLSRAEAHDGVRISSASIFEVAALHTSGRLRLARALEQWVRDAMAARGVRLAPLSIEMALDAGAIPRSALPDPLDRLLSRRHGSSMRPSSRTTPGSSDMPPRPETSAFTTRAPNPAAHLN